MKSSHRLAMAHWQKRLNFGGDWRSGSRIRIRILIRMRIATLVRRASVLSQSF